VNKTHASTYWL